MVRVSLYLQLRVTSTLTMMGRNAYYWIGVKLRQVYKVEAFRRRIVIILSAYSIETMATSIQAVKKSTLGNLGQEVG